MNITYFYTYTFLYSFTGLTPLKGVGPLGVVVDPFPEFQSIIQKILERLMETKTLKSFQIPKCLLFPQFHHGKFLLNNNNNNSPPILLSTKPEYHRVELQWSWTNLTNFYTNRNTSEVVMECWIPCHRKWMLKFRLILTRLEDPVNIRFLTRVPCMICKEGAVVSTRMQINPMKTPQGWILGVLIVHQVNNRISFESIN